MERTATQTHADVALLIIQEQIRVLSYTLWPHAKTMIDFLMAIRELFRYLLYVLLRHYGAEIFRNRYFYMRWAGGSFCLQHVSGEGRHASSTVRFRKLDGLLFDVVHVPVISFCHEARV